MAIDMTACDRTEHRPRLHLTGKRCEKVHPLRTVLDRLWCFVGFTELPVHQRLDLHFTKERARWYRF